MTNLYRVCKIHLFFFFLFCSSLAFGQTKGLIYKPASTEAGRKVLDPNGDGYTSATTAGFTGNDWGWGESEIKYQRIPILENEPIQDPLRGPGCGFTDMVDSGEGDPVMFYFDGTNFLVRFRLNKTSPNSKGYSVLIDADEKFGFTGPNADPNAVSGNPGFELELVLKSNFGVSLYNIDGSASTPTGSRILVDHNTLTFDAYAQKSVAFTEECGDLDYFYDFYIPWSYFKLPASTKLRMTALTVMNPHPATGNNAKSDVGGVDDSKYGGDYDRLFQDFIENFNPSAPNDIDSGIQERSKCPAISGPVFLSASSIKGTSSEVNNTPIYVYKNGIVLGTAYVTEGSWQLSGVSGLKEGDVITAVAEAAGKGTSAQNCNAITVIQGCDPIPSPTVAEASSNKYISVTLPITQGGTIEVYEGGATTPVASFENAVAGQTYCYNDGGILSGTSCGSGSHNIRTGSYRIVLKVGSCSSEPAFACIGKNLTYTATPTLSSPAGNSGVNVETSEISGKAEVGARVTLLINGTLHSAVVTDAGGAWEFSSLVLKQNDALRIYAIASGKCKSENLDFVVGGVISDAPIITGNYCASTGGSSLQITGTSAEADGTIIELFRGSTSLGTTTVYNGSWTKVATVFSGDNLTARATAPRKTVSNLSASKTITAPPSVPVISVSAVLPLNAGDASTTLYEGTTSFRLNFSSSVSGTIRLYSDGFLIKEQESFSGSSWDISGLADYELYNGGNIYVTVASGSCESDYSNMVPVVCRAPLANLSLSPNSSTICAGSEASFDILSPQPFIIYQLYNGANKTGSSVLGQGSSVTLTSGAIMDNASLSVRALKIGVDCETTVDNTHAVAVTNPITKNTVSAPGGIENYCGPTAIGEIEGSAPEGGDGNYIYEWHKSATGAEGSWGDVLVKGPEHKNFNPGTVTANTYFRRTVYSGACVNENISASVLITISPAISNTISYEGTTSSYTNSLDPDEISGNPDGTYYQWQTSIDGVNYTDIAEATSASYNPPAINSTTPVTIFIRRRVSSGACNSFSEPVKFTITPNQSPVADAGEDQDGLTADVNGKVSVSLDGSASTDPEGSALNYSWIIKNSEGNEVKAATGEKPSINLEAGTYTVVLTVSDDKGATHSDEVVIRVAAYVDQAPVVVQPTEAVKLAENSAEGTAVFAVEASDGEGDKLTYAIIEGEGSGNFAIDANGNITVAEGAELDYESAEKTYTLVIEVADGKGGKASTTITINITDINEAPVADAGADQPDLQADRNGKVSVSLDGSASYDPEDEELSYSWTDGDQTVAGVNPGIILEAGEYTITLTVTDDKGLTATDDVLVKVAAYVNQAPVVVEPAEAVELAENSAEGTVFTVEASDVEGDKLSYTITEGSDKFAIDEHGNITLAADAVLDYESAEKTYTLVVEVKDGKGGKTTVTITINITDANEAPVASQPATAVSIAENSAEGTAVYEVDASDVDGDDLSYTIIEGVGSGNFTIDANGNITVAEGANLDYENEDQYVLTIRVTEDTADKLFAEVTLTVNITDVDEIPANTAPVANAGTYADDLRADVNGEVSIILDGSASKDADGSIASYSWIIKDADGGMEVIVTGVKPELSLAAGTYTIVLTVTDDKGESDTDEIIITIAAYQNQSPVANAGADQGDLTANAENEASVTLDGSASKDADGTIVSYSWSITDTEGTRVIATVAQPTVTLSAGTHTITLTVTDNKGDTDTDEVVITVAPYQNQSPELSQPAAEVRLAEDAENGTEVFTVVATDADDDALNYTIVSGNDEEIFTIDSDGKITLLAADKLDYETNESYTLTVEVTDGKGGKVTIVLTVNITDVDETPANQVPVAEGATVSVPENLANGTAIHTVGATDADGDELSYAITAGNDAGVFVINPLTGSITLADAEKLDYETTQQFVLTVEVGDGTASVEVIITINITDVEETPANQAPEVAEPAVTVRLAEDAANGTVVYTIEASDADGDELSYTIISGNDDVFAIDAEGNISLIGAGELDYEKEDSYVIIVEVADGEGGTTTVEITVNIEKAKQAPVADAGEDQLLTAGAEGSAELTLDGSASSDADGAIVAYSWAIEGEVIATGVNPGLRLEAGTYVIELTVTDDTGLSASDVVTITVNPYVNQIPVAHAGANQTVTAGINGTAAVTLDGSGSSDADGSILSYSWSIDGVEMATGANATVELPAGTYTVVLTITDDKGASTTAEVSITVNPYVNQAPLAEDATIDLDENSPEGTAVHKVMATDAEGDELTYSITAGNNAGAFQINTATGAITVADGSQLDYETVQQFVLTVSVSDGALGTTATITINIKDVDESPAKQAPVAEDATVELKEKSADGTQVHTVIASDPEGEVLSYSFEAGNEENIFAIDPATGAITVADGSKLDYESRSQYVLVIGVSNGALSTTATITINILEDDEEEDPLNRAPEAEDATLSIREDATNGTAVHIVVAADPDEDMLTFSIEAGNEGGAFAIDPVTGEITVADQSQLDYDSKNSYTLLVRVEDEGGLSGQAVITINLQQVGKEPVTEVELEIPLGYSPNNDGIGDAWVIKGIERYGNNKLKIFNRWGNMVYEATGYNNETRVWSGESNGKFTPGKREVPDGTYFYVLDLGNGSKPLSGYIIIKR